MRSQQTISFGPYPVAQLRDVSDDFVATCRDYIDAVNLCMNMSIIKRTRRKWAELLEMSEGNLNLILNRGGSSGRRRYLDPDLFEQIQLLAGNRAIAQFFDMQIRGGLYHQNTQHRIDELEAELERLRKEAN